MLSDIVIFLIFSSKSHIDFHNKTVLVKNLKHVFYEEYIKLICIVPEEKCLARIRFLNPFIKLAITYLLVKFACFNLEAKFSDVNLLNSAAVIYLLLWLWSVISFSISLIFML